MPVISRNTKRETPREALPPVPAQPIYVIVKHPIVETLEGTSDKAGKEGKPYSIRSQAAHVYNKGLDEFPSRFLLQLRDNELPYPTGFYFLSVESLTTGGFDDLIISPVLVPCPKPAGALGA